MKAFWNNIFLARNFYLALCAVGLVFILGHFYHQYHTLALVLLALTTLALSLDLILLYRINGISAKREVSGILSNGDKNEVKLTIVNQYPHSIFNTVYEEIPYQLSLRELKFKIELKGESTGIIRYDLEPKERGEYDFGNIVSLVKTPLCFITKRYVSKTEKKVAVYPSFSRINQNSFSNFKRYSTFTGTKKTRRIGYSLEFEHIKDYIKGDDIRHINWKSSAKHGDLMVNQYREERAQQIYCIIDTGRTMEMPYNGLSLLDYAINSCLVLSHVIIKNHDRAGVIHFSKKVEKILPANKAITQLPKVLNLLYKVETDFAESNFEQLYGTIKYKLSHRSLLLLFTNFEDMNSLDRQLPSLRGMAKNNVLVVIFFNNKELQDVTTKNVNQTKEYYEKAVAEKMVYEKKLMVKKLRANGILNILSDPEDLTTNTIDKYLEIKSRGII